MDSRLISPSLQLPELVDGEELHLRFWHWFSINHHDALAVTIQEEVSPGVWGAWTTLATYTRNSGGVWTRPLIDLSAYAGKRVRLAYFLNNHGSRSGVGSGWYIDDIRLRVVVGLPDHVPYNDDFESGLGHWFASNGVWQVGESPTAGPRSCFGDSESCAGTVLDGNYPDWVDSRLISPSLQLPELVDGEELHLRFWHWFSINHHDALAVTIQEEVSPGVWGAWTTLATYTRNSGGVWTRPLIDLSAYAGKRVRLAYFLNNHGSRSGVGSGWYIDDILIDKL